MNRPQPLQHRLALALGLAALLLAGTGSALAGPVEDAEALFAAGKTEPAREALGAWLDGTELDTLGLLHAAQLARRLQDLELLNAIAGAAQDLESQISGEVGPTLHLALGVAYLGLAEENLRQRTASRSVSLYFADALERAAKVPVGGSLGCYALRLAAETRYAQGDLDGAIAGIHAGIPKLASGSSALLQALHGRLRYTRGVARGTKADGHPADDAAPEFAAATEILPLALKAGLPPLEARAARLQLAWAHHRTGGIDGAVEAYQASYRSDAREGVLAIRGLRSLLARDGKRLVTELEKLVARHPKDEAPAAALTDIHLSTRNTGDALLAAHKRLEASPDDVLAIYGVGRVHAAAGQLESAKRYFVAVLKRQPNHIASSYGIERLAQTHLAKDPARAVAIYEELIALRPDDPYTRNNLGFILRDLVSRETVKERGGIERLKPGATKQLRGWLDRCVSVYAEAVARIDPAQDADLTPATAWNLAGIINDYGLIVHYFIEVQDAKLAEQQYLRALRMTDFGFKDTYTPNLHRLYRYVLKDRDWTWYRIAREAKDSILREGRDERGRVVLLPDDQKREAARQDMLAARARILQALKMDADEDGLPWPPGKENGNDR